jgi:inward rectifier potassium channel
VNKVVQVEILLEQFTYKDNSVFQAVLPLKLVRSRIAYLTHGMIVRHNIDNTSPLHQKTPEMLNKEDATFCLTISGLERAAMQPVFHVQHFCVINNEVIWDAEFEDVIRINKNNERIVDHSRLSMWKPVSD